MKRKIVALVVSCGAVALAIACTGKTSDVATGDGGSSSSSGGSGSSGGSSGSSGSSGGLVAGCPASPPVDNSACTSALLECEYGTDVDPKCNVQATCASTGRWSVSTPSTTSCPTPAPGAGCPVSYAAVSPGATCPAAATCAYPEGTCVCEVYCGSQFPVGRTCDAGTPLTWQCGGASPGCPVIRPHAGTACTQDQQECSYGDCTAPAMKCVSGSWHGDPQSCPVSSRTKKQDIRYLSDDDLRALADRTLATRLATYRYTSGDPSTHLGFVIEDDPSSPAVAADQGHVDLYAYSSMTVATLQLQSREIAELRREVDALKRELEASRKTPRK